MMNWIRHWRMGALGRMSAMTAVVTAVMTAAPAFAEDPAVNMPEDDFSFEHVSCTGAPHEIRIIVGGVKKNAGLMTADLYPNRQEGFLKGDSRLKQVRFAAKSPQTKFCLTAPEAGAFAIAVYHDRNANGDFDKTGFGLPAEPWGLSMNPKVRFKAPTVDKAIFPVAETGANVKIKLN